MCPRIGTDRDPSSPNYPHFIHPCRTLRLNIYGYSNTHGHTHTYSTNALRHTHAHSPLNVASCRRLYHRAILGFLASSGRTKLSENKSIFNNMGMGKSLGPLQSATKVKKKEENKLEISTDLSSSQRIPITILILINIYILFRTHKLYGSIFLLCWLNVAHKSSVYNSIQSFED